MTESNSRGRSPVAIRRRPLRRVFLALLATLLGACAWFRPSEPDKVQMHSAAASEGDLLAGAAVVDITPERNCDMGGFHIGRMSTGVHDPLCARALAFKRGSFEQVLVAVDLVGLFHPFVGEILAQFPDLPPGHLIIASTHDHSSPDSMGIWGSPPFKSGLDPEFMAKVRRGILQSIREAREHLVEAELGCQTVAVTPANFIKNRNRKGFVDPEVAVLHVRRKGGGPTIATLVELGCHPEVVPDENTLVSADFPGYTVRALEREFGGVGIYVSGDLGALVSPVRHLGDRHEGVFWEEAQRMGEELAAYAGQAVRAIPGYESAPRLAVYHTPIYLLNENFYFDVMRLTGIIHRPEYGGGYIESEVNLWEIGSLRVATLPGELSPDIGMHIKKYCGHPAMIVGLANDELGYLFPSYDFDMALYDYERTLSVGKLAGDRLQRWIEDLVDYADFSQQIHGR